MRTLEEITSEARTVLERSYAAWGRLMLEAKGLVPHGKFQKYLMDNFPEIGERQARRYMELARDETKTLTQITQPTRESKRSTKTDLERESQAIESRNEEIFQKTSFVPGFIIHLDNMNLDKIEPYELALLRQACERLIDRIDAKGETRWPRLVVGK